MELFIYLSVIIIWCLLFAKLEVEIEGNNGWATATPTARYSWDKKTLKYRPFNLDSWEELDHTKGKGKFIYFYITKLLGGRDFTTYHRVIDIIQLFIAHLTVWGIFYPDANLLILEIRVFGTILLFWSIEDTCWFFLNPLYGFKKYNKKSIPWHSQDKWFILPFGVIILLFAGILIVTVSFML
jgi:hypothetical protein